MQLREMEKFGNIKKEKKKDGFVLALAIVVLGIVLSLTTLMLALGATQNSNTNLMQFKIETEILCDQIEHDFISLSESEFKAHMIKLGGEKEEQNENNFIFKDKIKVKILNQYNDLEIYDYSNDKVILTLKR